MSDKKHFLQIDTSNLEIPLRYYRGWDIQFHVKTESFCCPFFSLYRFSSVKDLEKAIDFAIVKRNELPPLIVGNKKEK